MYIVNFEWNKQLYYSTHYSTQSMINTKSTTIRQIHLNRQKTTAASDPTVDQWIVHTMHILFLFFIIHELALYNSTYLWNWPESTHWPKQWFLIILDCSSLIRIKKEQLKCYWSHSQGSNTVTHQDLYHVDMFFLYILLHLPKMQHLLSLERP